ncbi:hypothetical protein AB0H77_18860 [Streptomyces sp. NPDC050844]|uniref:hypothetical protein n=1 Tax=Streptomyces sp. NPDC050844 TaxID=3155790 RepID=UPI0033FE58E1
MPDNVPTRVAVYGLDRVPPQRIAEFRWSGETGVIWSVLDAESARVVEEFTHGLRIDGGDGRVRPVDGAHFMHALLTWQDTGDHLLVDESDGAVDWGAWAENPRRARYFVLFAKGGSRDEPTGVVRRLDTDPPTDQAFRRQYRRWLPTQHFELHRQGESTFDHVEISHADAMEVIRRSEARWAREDAERAAGQDSTTGERITYYARVDESHPRDNPRGIARRRHTDPPTDEVFARDMQWRPTEYLRRYWLGQNDVDHVEITEGEAREITSRWQEVRYVETLRARRRRPIDETLPMYFEFYNRTYRIEPGPDGREAGYELDIRSGEIEEDDSHIWEARNPRTHEIKEVDESRYLDLTEAARAHYLRGDGPVFALYAAIDSIYAHARSCARRPTVEEEALIRVIRRRTFALWEKEFARRSAGRAPSFTSWSILVGRPDRAAPKDVPPLPPHA